MSEIMSDDWDAAAHVRFLRANGGAASGYTADLIERQNCEITRLKASLDKAMEALKPQPIETAPTDGTHIIGLTQWGWREVWWHRDTYEGEYWQDEGDSEPEPKLWIPKPDEAVGDLRKARDAYQPERKNDD